MGIIQRDSFRITLISYTGAIIGYLNKVFLFTNFLATEQVGLANLMVTLAMIYAQIAALGTHNITLRYLPFFKDRENNHHGFLTGMMALAMAGFLIFTLLLLFLRRPFVLFYHDSSPLLVEYAVYIIPMALATTYYLLFESYLRSLYKNIVPSVIHELGLRLLITLSILLFALGLISFPGFVAIYVAANCLPAIILIAYTGLIRQLRIAAGIPAVVRKMGRLMLAYGLFSLLNNLGMFLLISIDSLMVAGMIDLAATGIYTTMIFLGSVMLIPYRSMVKVGGPVVARYWKENDMDGMRVLYKKASAGNLVVGAALFTLLWVNLDSIFFFMPGQYEAGRYVFLLLALGKLFDMSAGLNGVILLTSSKYRYDLWFTLSLVAFALLSNLALIPVLGIQGAALASMATLILFNLTRILFIRHHYRLQPFSSRQAWVLPIMAAVMGLSQGVPRMVHVFVDIPVRSLLALGLLLTPLYFLEISPDLNKMGRQYLDGLRQWFAKT